SRVDPIHRQQCLQDGRRRPLHIQERRVEAERACLTRNPKFGCKEVRLHNPTDGAFRSGTSPSHFEYRAAFLQAAQPSLIAARPSGVTSRWLANAQTFLASIPYMV